MLINQEKKSNNKVILFHFLLTQAQEYNEHIINFTSVDYERYKTSLKGSSDLLKEVNKEWDNELTNFMSYFGVAITKTSNEKYAFDLAILNSNTNGCENTPTSRQF